MTDETPGDGRARLPAWAPPLLFTAAAIVFTWPLAVTSDKTFSLRPDYFQNLWNLWWVRTALFEQDLSLYWTDYEHFPLGISLGKYTLSLVNAIPGSLLSYVLGFHDAFKVLVLAHFALSGWFFYLFARYATGATVGALVAGFLWSFTPYHFHYMPQINLTTLEFLPLAALFMMKAYQEGGLRNILGVALSAGLLAASASYYTVYAALLGGALLVGGRLWAPHTPWATGARRLASGGAIAGVVVVVIAWPLLSAALMAPPEPEEEITVEEKAIDPDNLAEGSNDLLGFRWVLGPPEKVIVSWPTMFGYTCLLLVAAGFRGAWRHRFWMIVALAFGVLSLGITLAVGGEDTGIPLPYGALLELPVLSMLRKPDRIFIVAQLAFALLCAAAWKDVGQRMTDAVKRRRLGVLWASLIMLEFAAIPLRLGDVPASPYFERLARDESVESILELPVLKGGFDARANYYQTIHGRKTAGGYVTNLAGTSEHKRERRHWKQDFEQLCRGEPRRFKRRIRESGIDMIIVHKTTVESRSDSTLHGDVVWTPFVVMRHELIRTRQRGNVFVRDVARLTLDLQRRMLTESYGPPEHEDDEIIVFRVPADDGR